MIDDRRSPLPRATLACWTVAAIAIAAGAAAACPDGACRALAPDRWLLEAFHAAREPWLDAFFAAFTWLGSIVVLLPASLALGWAWRRRGDRSSAWRLPLAVGGAWLLAHAGKLLVSRPRPDLHAPVIAMPADLSFPSSHAMVAAAFAVALALRPRPSPTLVAAAALVALVVAVSRMYLQVHYPSDVAAGVVAGAAWALGLCLLPGVRR
jgi:undecaprenyl-diphosphatase